MALVTLGSDSRLLSEGPRCFKAVWSCSFSLTGAPLVAKKKGGCFAEKGSEVADILGGC